MESTGKIKDGLVVLDGVSRFEEGTVVTVHSIDDAPPLLGDLFRDIVGKAVDLPPDLAENHDHYLHGLPPKSSQ